MPVVLIGIPLLVLLAAFVAYGSSQLVHSQSKGWIGWLEGVATTASGIGLFIATNSLKLTSWLTHQLGKYFEQVVHVAVQWVAGLSQYMKLTADVTMPWAVTVADVMWWLVKKEIPRQLKALPTRVEPTVKYVTKEVKGIGKTVYKFPKLSRAQVQAAIAVLLPGTLVGDFALLRWLRAHFHELTATLPRTIPYPAGKTIAGIKARLKKLEWITAGGLAIGVVVAALTRLGLGFIRCGNVKKVGKSVCGMNPGLLESLLLDTVAIFSVLSVVEFAKELRLVEDEAVTLMGKLVKEWPPPPKSA